MNRSSVNLVLLALCVPALSLAANEGNPKPVVVVNETLQVQGEVTAVVDEPLSVEGELTIGNTVGVDVLTLPPVEISNSAAPSTHLNVPATDIVSFVQNLSPIQNMLRIPDAIPDGKVFVLTDLQWIGGNTSSQNAYLEIRFEGFESQNKQLNYIVPVTQCSLFSSAPCIGLVKEHFTGGLVIENVGVARYELRYDGGTPANNTLILMGYFAPATPAD